MYENVPIGLQYAYGLHDRNPKEGITNTCNYPHKVLTVDVEGNCMLCGCDAWLPISVANIIEVSKLEQVWEKDLAKQLQKDVDDKKYSWCSVESCGIRNEDQIKSKFYVSINVDESCNLACPSCRSHKINWVNGPKYDSRLKIAKHLVGLINNFNHPLDIMMSGNGDPLASLIYRPLLLEMKPKENIDIRLLTNGLLLKKIVPKIKVKDNIKHLDISIDAGDKETYEKVRLGGVWEQLISNLDFVKENFDCEVTLKFVLQNRNLESLDNFVRLLEKYQFRGNIMPLEDWSSMKDFQNHNIFSKDHSNHAQMLKKLEQYKRHPLLFFHSIII